MIFKKSDFRKNDTPPTENTSEQNVKQEDNELEQLDLKSMFYRFAPVEDDDEDTCIKNEDNLIVGEKLGTTMNAVVSMERMGDGDGTVTNEEKDLPEYRTIMAKDEPRAEDEPESDIPTGEHRKRRSNTESNDEITGERLIAAIREANTSIDEAVKEEPAPKPVQTQEEPPTPEQAEQSEQADIPAEDIAKFEAPVEFEKNIQLGGENVGGRVAEDIIESVPQFDIKPIIVEDIDAIDVDIADFDPEGGADVTLTTEKEALSHVVDQPSVQEADEPKAQDSIVTEVQDNTPDTSSAVQTATQESRVPVYTPENRHSKLRVNAGKFSVVVRQEYEEYLKSKNPEISATYHPVETVVTEEIRTVRNLKKSFISGLMDFFSANPDGERYETQTTSETVRTVDDYDDREDARNAAHEISDNLRQLRFRNMALLLITIITAALTVIQSSVPHSVAVSNGVTPIVFAGLNLLFIVAGVFISKVTVLNGLSVLKRFRGNSDTAVAVASVGSVVAGTAALFANSEFFNGSYSYYSVPVLLGLLCNAFGKLIMVRRIDKNFRFMINNKRLKAAKIYTDETIAASMMSGTVVEKPIIAYQHKTDFLTNFLQLSYAPDPSEEAAGKLAPFTTACSLAVAILYGVTANTVVGGIAAFSLMSAVSMPICCIMAANIPMKGFCKKLLKRGAMLSGFQAVKQFCDTTAIMVDSEELYPEGSVVLNGIKSFNDKRLDSACLAAAAVLKEVKSPLAPVFDEAMQESRSALPDVESVMYEDQLGLVGWVNGERILVGSRDLMKKYSIDIPEIDFEDTYRRQHKQITFLALGGLLTAMMVTTYRPNVEIAKELQRAEQNGISILVSTCDCNITSEQLSEDFGVFYRSVKVLPTGLGNVCKEVTSAFQERSRAYLATRGRFTQLARALSGCVRLKTNISISVMIQVIGVVLGILIMSVITLYSGMSILGTVPVLIYSVLWGTASILISIIKKP